MSPSYYNINSNSPVYGNDTSGLYTPTGTSGGIFVSVVGSLIGLLLVVGSLTTAYFMSKARAEGAATLSSSRLREEIAEAKELKEKPELVEVLVEAEEAVEVLGSLCEEVVPLALALLPSKQDSSNHSKSSSRAIISFLILSPSPPPLELSIEPQPSPLSSSSSSALSHEEDLDLVFGSSSVWLDMDEEERSELMEFGRKTEAR
ncbi:hypothetical protein BDY24DRAFT_375634 [Mrakia frigida]|uniref:uncharacterized protein n=1 Tax=Mrakia frigida TaxID=29902 RepID=UPI003FCC1DAB